VTQILRTFCDGTEGALFMTRFYLRPAIVVLSVYLFFGASSARAQEDYWLQQNLEQLQQQQQLDQLQREQEPKSAAAAAKRYAAPASSASGAAAAIERAATANRSAPEQAAAKPV
jgi:serine kinase of HPr protein (carbohydrate metabolism regulator)